MNKKVLISLAGAALISTGLATIAVEGGNTVDAAKTSLVKGKAKKLARNAYVYNSKGKRVKKRSLKKGKKIKILGFKTIKGKKYVQIGKNEYVVAANFTPKKAKSKPKKNTKKNTSKKVAPSTENEDDSYQEKAPSYANEPEYKKYMEWVEGNGYIVAKNNTKGVRYNGMNPDIDNVFEKSDSVYGVEAGSTLPPMFVYDVVKGSKGNYYIETYDEDDEGASYFPAKDFEFKHANYETSASSVDLKNDPQLKKYNDALIKMGKKDDGSTNIVVTKQTQIYKNTLNSDDTPDIKLSVADTVKKNTIISVSTEASRDYDDRTRIIKYNGDYYYTFYYGNSADDPDLEKVEYVKISDTTLASQKTLDKQYSYEVPNAYNDSEDDD